MRIVSWNCGWKYWDGKKHSAITTEYKPDILGISECNPINRLPANIAKECVKCVEQERSMFKKALAAFVLNPQVECRLPEDRYFGDGNPSKYSIPLRISWGAMKINLIFFWNYRDKYQWDFYADFIKENPTVIIGDFNWPSYYSDATVLKTQMEGFGLSSVYHTRMKKDYGQEDCATFYPRNKCRSLFIDYCFASNDLMNRLEFSVGQKEKWIDTGLSEHCPLILDVKV